MPNLSYIEGAIENVEIINILNSTKPVMFVKMLTCHKQPAAR